MAYLSGWADVLCIVRYQTFVAQLTGNIVFFGLSIAPAELRETAGVVNNPTLYLCVLLSNICGVGCLRLLQRLTKYPGVGLAIVTLLLMLLGDLIFALVVRSPWCALFFSPCFGAINALSTGPPLSVSVVTMTANTQKLPEWLLECLGNRQWLRVPVGAVLPLPALLGAATGAALLWADDARWYTSHWSSIPIIIALATTLVLHDVLANLEAASARGKGEHTPLNEPLNEPLM